MSTRFEGYSVAWICAISIEYVAACELLDEEYAKDNVPKIDVRRDSNLYTFGRIHEHNVVIACLPHGRYGTTSAAIVARDMCSTFPALRFGLFVGIAGGAPTKERDIRLGDVVISSPTPGYGGVLQYDFGKALAEKRFEETSYLSPPPEILLNALSNIKMRHKRKGHDIANIVANMLSKNKRLRKEYGRPDAATDQLYEESPGGIDRLTARKDRDPDEDDPAIHYGLVASANSLMKDRNIRNALATKHDVLCFEMEAAGLMNNFPCLVIRGICDYSDAYKNDVWQGYAAANAAAYTKELLGIIPGKDVESMNSAEEANKQRCLEDVPTAKRFIERPKEMQNLQRMLLVNDQDCRRKIFVLRGLGGIGKTQLAVEFMRKFQREFSSIFWVNGSSEDNLKQSLTKQINRISFSQPTSDFPARSEGTVENVDTMVHEMLDWLAITENKKWLLVFDNVDREFQPSDPQSYDIRNYFPVADHGSILITTRLSRLEHLGESQEVKQVDEAIAKSILTSWYKGPFGKILCITGPLIFTIADSKVEEIEVMKLLEKLDGLPLAIAQAGAFLQESGLSISSYIRLYEDQWDELAHSSDESGAALSDYSNKSVWTTWNISFDAIAGSNPHVTNLLLLWSYLDNGDLWYGIFEEAGRDPMNAQILSRWIGNIASKEIEFSKAMKLLRSYSLVEAVQSMDSYTTHPVVHRWTYFAKGQQYDLELGFLAVVVVVFATLLDLTAMDVSFQRRRLLSHIYACFSKIHRVDLEKADEGAVNKILPVIHRTATLSYSRSKSKDAGKMFVLAMQGCENILGANRTLMLYVAYGQSVFYIDQGKFNEAGEILEPALKSCQVTLGANHRLTAHIVYDLAGIYTDQCRFDKAEEMYAWALKSFEETLGALDESTLWSMCNLATLYAKRGESNKAEQMYTRALEGFEQSLGMMHTSTLHIFSLLANLYAQQNEFGKAEIMYTRALEGYEETLGPEDKTTLAAISDLGRLYSNQGKLQKAEQMYLRALQGFEGLNAMDFATHLLAVSTMVRLGDIYCQDRLHDAKIMFEKALLGYTIVEGDTSETCLQLKRALDNLELSAYSGRPSSDGSGR